MFYSLFNLTNFNCEPRWVFLAGKEDHVRNTAGEWGEGDSVRTPSAITRPTTISSSLAYMNSFRRGPRRHNPSTTTEPHLSDKPLLYNSSVNTRVPK